MLPVVATSLNPASRLQYQLKCFAKWKALGFQIYTFNTQNEAEDLQSNGVESKSIVVVDRTQTGAELFGRAIPRILPILRHVEINDTGRPLVLVNSDIYPAARSGDIFRYWMSYAPAVALTREEVVSVATFNPTGPKRPYRGGLDAFVFRSEALVGINGALSQIPVSERMCFGVPGWDFFLGAMVRSPAIGGKIADSRLLLHEMHHQTYSDIDEFANYIPPMNHIGAITRDDVTGAAEEFARIIDADCNKSDDRSERAGILYACPVSFRARSMRPVKICFDLMARYPWVKWNYDLPSMVALADKYSDDHSLDNRILSEFFAISPSEHHRFSEILLALVFHFLCRPGSLSVIRREYAVGNLHAAAVLHAIKISDGKFTATRLEMARLLFRETTQFGIFNYRLLKFLILCCENDLERTLVKEVHDTFGGHSSVA